MGKKKYTKESYTQYLLSLLPESNFTFNIYDGTEKLCVFTCNICGKQHSFTEANKIARRAKRGNKNVCKYCEKNQWTEKQNLAKNKALYMLKEKETIELIGNLKSWASSEKATWKCLKCNHEFSRAPLVMFTQNGLYCPWCETHPFIYTEEMIKEKAKDLWGDEYSFLKIDALKNKNGSKRVLVCHNKCGFKYSVNLYNFLHGQGCPKCKKSHGEKRVRKYLTKHGFVFQEQYSIFINNTCLKFDFYLEENNKKYAIEYNGIQHYKPIDFFGGEEGLHSQQIRDSFKKEYCKENDIDLIIIPYNDESLINSEKLAQRLSN